jgi:DNA-binding MarR family transcriptional regulator
MTKSTAEQNLDARAQLFKALGHPTRLLILNLVKIKPRHGEELAAILRLQPATISHHLAILTDAGLLSSIKDQYYQMYFPVSDLLQTTLEEMITLPQPGLPKSVKVDAYRDNVLKTFFKHGRLVSIPAQLKKRQVILEKIVEEFEPDRKYTEREVNQVLVEFHDDVASLRRGLISQKLMQRKKGMYWRIIENSTR